MECIIQQNYDAKVGIWVEFGSFQIRDSQGLQEIHIRCYFHFLFRRRLPRARIPLANLFLTTTNQFLPDDV